MWNLNASRQEIEELSSNKFLGRESIADNGDHMNKIDISFTNLCVVLQNGKKILNDITGKLEAGTMTAIMGPSGCGKSTTICALTNRIKNGGVVTGNILINGKKTHLMSIQHLVGFVPQDDIMHRDLTVRETLKFQARLKADPRFSGQERRAFVNEVLDILGLTHVQHTLIGDELVRGISGGQRKRVNIGCELMGSPLVLFLDEPTSGLDATTTMELIESLETLSALGLTIAMVIHQPRSEVLAKIDNLMLLQRGGWPVYLGPTAKAPGYFEYQLGLTCPPNTAVADFYLDVITANQTQTFAYGDLTECWNKYAAGMAQFSEFNKADLKKQNQLMNRPIPPPNRPGRIRQAYYFFKRSFRQVLNTKKKAMVDAVILIMAGALAGFVSSDPSIGNQMTVCINGIMSIMSALRVFGPEKSIFLREMHGGCSATSYMLGKSLAYLPTIFLNPIFFLASFYRLSMTSMRFEYMYMIILCVNFSATGIGYIVSLVTAPGSSQLAGVTLGLVGIMTSGLNPPLKELSGGVLGNVLVKMTYGSYGLGSLFLTSSFGMFSYTAGLGKQLDFMAKKGFLDERIDTYSDEDVDEAAVIVREKVVGNLKMMMLQYLVYSGLSWLVLFLQSKEEVGGLVNSFMFSPSVVRLRAGWDSLWNGPFSEKATLARMAMEKKLQLRRAKQKRAPNANANKEAMKDRSKEGLDKQVQKREASVVVTRTDMV
jgi:ABC-type multidrug transport system ATPase subunit